MQMEHSTRLRALLLPEPEPAAAACPPAATPPPFPWLPSARGRERGLVTLWARDGCWRRCCCGVNGEVGVGGVGEGEEVPMEEAPPLSGGVLCTPLPCE